MESVHPFVNLIFFSDSGENFRIQATDHLIVAHAVSAFYLDS